MTSLQKLRDVRAAALSGDARETRRASRISLSELAREIGVHPTCLQAWEKGEFLPRHDNALRWHEALTRLGWRA